MLSGPPPLQGWGYIKPETLAEMLQIFRLTASAPRQTHPHPRQQQPQQ